MLGVSKKTVLRRRYELEEELVAKIVSILSFRQTLEKEWLLGLLLPEISRLKERVRALISRLDRASGVASAISEGAYSYIRLKSIRFQRKLIVQNTNILICSPHLSRWRRHWIQQRSSAYPSSDVNTFHAHLIKKIFTE